MSAAKYDFIIEQGTTYRDEFTWRVDDGSNPPVGDIIDLTGCTARMQLRSSVTDTTYILELTTENGGIILHPGAADPNIEILITDSQTSSLTFTSAVYDMEIEMSNGDVRRILKGTVSLDLEVTR